MVADVSDNEQQSLVLLCSLQARKLCETSRRWIPICMLRAGASATFDTAQFLLGKQHRYRTSTAEQDSLLCPPQRGRCRLGCVIRVISSTILQHYALSAHLGFLIWSPFITCWYTSGKSVCVALSLHMPAMPGIVWKTVNQKGCNTKIVNPMDAALRNVGLEFDRFWPIYLSE